MIDKTRLLETTDLMALVSTLTTLRKTATTNGGEWVGPCPVCGGKDRFHVQPYRKPWGAWFCRNCTGVKWQDAISLIMHTSPNLDFRSACQFLGGRESSPAKPLSQQASLAPAYAPPGGTWQIAAHSLIYDCEDALWSQSGKKALDYLHSRGLKDETINRFHLGFRAAGADYAPGMWGFADHQRVYIEKGITIPCIVDSEVWYVKIRTNSNQAGKKYRGIRGNRTAAIFGASDLLSRGIDIDGHDPIQTSPSTAIFCEGEFDAMIAWQELNGVIPAVTLSSASNLPDLATWGAYLSGLDTIVAVYDNDAAGQAGAKALARLTNRARGCPLPHGHKDINEFVLSGGNLWDWLKTALA